MKVSTNLKIALAVFSATISIHVFHLDHAGFFLDEAIHLWNGQRSFPEIIHASANDSNPPFYNLITALWGRLIGISEFSARILSVLFLALASTSAYWLMGKHFNRPIGLLAALFIAFSPIQYRFSHLARPYSLLIFLAVTSYGLLFTALRKKSFSYVFLYLAITTMMLYGHPTSIFNLVPQGLIALSEFLKNKKISISAFMAAFLSACLFGAWYLSIPYFEKERGMWFDPPTTSDILNAMVELCGSPMLLNLLILATTAAIFKWLWTRSEGKELAWIMLWMITPLIVSIGFSHLIKPLFQSKYVITVQPAFMLMFAYAINGFFKGWIKWIVALIITAILASNIVWKPLPEGDWKGAVAHIKQNWDENTSALVNPWYEHATFAYYFDKEAFLNVSKTHFMIGKKRAYTDWEDFADEMTPSTEKLHLLLAAEGMVPYPIDLNVLDTMGRLIGYKEFEAVRILTYDFSKGNGASDSMAHNFTELNPEGMIRVDSDKPYSPRMEFEVHLKVPQLLRIRSEVSYSFIEFGDQVHHTISVLQNGHTVKYHSSALTNDLNSSGNMEHKCYAEFPLDTGYYQVWVNLWNPAGAKLHLYDHHTALNY